MRILNGVFARFTAADADRVGQVGDEDSAVAHLAGLRGASTAPRATPEHRATVPSSPKLVWVDLPAGLDRARERRRWHNRRREHDPLGEGQPCTWRTRLIKVAARVRQTTRRVLVELPSSRPYLKHFHQVSRLLLVTARARSSMNNPG